MPKMSDLGLTDERVGEDIDYATIPEQMGTFQDPPQPGSFRFRLPKQLDAIWEKFTKETGKNPGERVAAVFDSSFPLTIIASVGGKYDGLPFEARITNAERKRGKRDDESAPEVSDMDYLLRDAFGIERKPPTNKAYIQEMLKHAGAEFGADIEWSWNCSDRRDIRTADGTGRTVEVTGQKGCNTRYYQKDVDKVLSNPEDPNSEQVFPRSITCQCGANVRSFANLTRFRR